MSKSLGNVDNLLDLLDRYDERAYRMLLLQSHYRSPVRVERRTACRRPSGRWPASTRSPPAAADVAGDGRRRRARRVRARRWTTTSTRPGRWPSLFDTVRRANAALDAGARRGRSAGRRGAARWPTRSGSSSGAPDDVPADVLDAGRRARRRPGGQGLRHRRRHPRRAAGRRLDRRDHRGGHGRPPVRTSPGARDLPHPPPRPPRRRCAGTIRPNCSDADVRRWPTRLADSWRSGQRSGRRRRRPALPGRLGYQPGLDGLRGLSVLAVIGYHAGFGWLRGGWIGVEVFFVVSGFLITSLLVEEREATGRIDLRQFWLRRARRLLPALVVMLAVVAVVTLVVGSAAERAGVRRDLPWALAYVSNWGQIAGDVPYFAADPPVLRHLWSLAIEEQFYLVWPLAFVALAATRMRPVAIARLLAVLAAVAMLGHARDPGWVARVRCRSRRRRPDELHVPVDVHPLERAAARRRGGVRLAAGAAAHRHRGDPGRVLDTVGACALAVLACAAGAATLTAGVRVPVAAAAGVGRRARRGARRRPPVVAAGAPRRSAWRPLVAVGRRSYGLYLWHWPVFVLAGATHGAVGRFLTASAITVVRVRAQLPLRRDPGPARWPRAVVAPRRTGPQPGRADRRVRRVVLLAGCYGAVRPFDPAVGGEDATFTAPVADAGARRRRPVARPADHARRRPSIRRRHRRRLAGPLAVGRTSPDGLGRHVRRRERGDRRLQRLRRRARAERPHVVPQLLRDLRGLAGASGPTPSTRSDASVALVVLGAWDVFDRETADGSVLRVRHAGVGRRPPRAPAGGHRRARRRRRRASPSSRSPACGRSPSRARPCPPLPERADDCPCRPRQRACSASVAAANAATTTFVEGPDWCGDEAMATDVGMRWDGVHVYEPGAALIFDDHRPGAARPCSGVVSLPGGEG